MAHQFVDLGAGVTAKIESFTKKIQDDKEIIKHHLDRSTPVPEGVYVSHDSISSVFVPSYIFSIEFIQSEYKTTSFMLSKLMLDRLNNAINDINTNKSEMTLTNYYEDFYR